MHPRFDVRGGIRQTSKAQCVVLLENVRFHKGETKNDPAFAEQVREQDLSHFKEDQQNFYVLLPCVRYRQSLSCLGPLHGAMGLHGLLLLRRVGSMLTCHAFDHGQMT